MLGGSRDTSISPLPGMAVDLANGFRGVDMTELGTWYFVSIPGPMLELDVIVRACSLSDLREASEQSPCRDSFQIGILLVTACLGLCITRDAICVLMKRARSWHRIVLVELSHLRRHV